MTASVWFNSALTSFIGLTLACSSPAGPGDAPGIFVLTQVQQDPLPTVLSENEYFAVRVFSDTIRLREDGTGSISGVRESVPLQGGSSAGPIHIANGLHYRVVDGRIEIEFDCPPLATCIAGPHLIADRQGDHLVATWGPHMSGRSPLSYQKVTR
jgi:hypothetical protein